MPLLKPCSATEFADPRRVRAKPVLPPFTLAITTRTIRAPPSTFSFRPVVAGPPAPDIGAHFDTARSLSASMWAARGIRAPCTSSPYWAKRFLVLRRLNTGYEEGKLSVVTGHVEPGETVGQAAIRETREEVGLALSFDRIQMVGAMHRRSDDERVDFFPAHYPGLSSKREAVCDGW
jgi:8-oxo-dGTP pyrophosphatase MutT (NUDIX family)